MKTPTFDPAQLTERWRKSFDLLREQAGERQVAVDQALLALCRGLEIDPADVADRLMSKVRGRDCEIPDSLGGLLLCAVPFVADALAADERARCAPIPVALDGEPWETDGRAVFFRPGTFWPNSWTDRHQHRAGMEIGPLVAGAFGRTLTPVEAQERYADRSFLWFTRDNGENVAISATFSPLVDGAMLAQNDDPFSVVRASRDGVATAFVMPLDYAGVTKPESFTTIELGPLSRDEQEWMQQACEANARILRGQK